MLPSADRPSVHRGIIAHRRELLTLPIVGGLLQQSQSLKEHEV